MRSAGIRLAAVTTCVVALVGCGGGDGGNDQESAARDVAQQYVDAYNARDFGRLCQVLSQSYKQQLKVGSDCPGYFKEQTSGAATTLTLKDIEVKNNQAAADVRTESEESGAGERDETIGLIRQPDGSWRVVAVGSEEEG